MTDCLVRNSNLDCILLELAIRDTLIETLIVIRYCPLLTAVAGLCENAFMTPQTVRWNPVKRRNVNFKARISNEARIEA